MVCSRTLRFLSLTILWALAGAAPAEEALRPVWEAGAGVALLSMPDYRGSDSKRGYAFPIPYLVYRGEKLKVDRERISGLLFKSDRVQLDMSLSASPPVKSSGVTARAGMPDLDPTVELGPQLNVTLYEDATYRFTTHVPWRSVIAVNHQGLQEVGWITNPILNLDIKNVGPGGGWNVGISGGPIWGDHRFHNYYYGVDPAYATPTRSAFDASGGYSGSQLTLAISKRYEKMWVGTFVRYNDLHGTVFDDSPLLKSRTNYMYGIGISMMLAESKERVMSKD